MDINEAIDKITEKYPDTPPVDMDIFKAWINEFSVEDYEPIIMTIIKHDNRTSYLSKLPTYVQYNKFFEDNKIIIRGELDSNSLDYVKSKTQDWPITKLVDYCITARAKVKENIPNGSRNKLIDFLHLWDILSAEKYHAEENEMPEPDVWSYLSMIKECIIKGTSWERPWKSTKAMNEFQRIKKTVSISEVLDATDGALN